MAEGVVEVDGQEDESQKAAETKAKFAELEELDNHIRFQNATKRRWYLITIAGAVAVALGATSAYFIYTDHGETLAKPILFRLSIWTAALGTAIAATSTIKSGYRAYTAQKKEQQAIAESKAIRDSMAAF